MADHINVIIKCTEWGIGINYDENGNFIFYGFPIDENPNLFEPDYESSSEDEVLEHKRAIEKWNKENNHDAV